MYHFYLANKDLNWKLLLYPELYLGEEYCKGNIEIENGSIYDYLNVALKKVSHRWYKKDTSLAYEEKLFYL